MRMSFARFAMAALMAGVLSTAISPAAAAAEPLRVGGTGAAFGLLQRLGDAFSARSGIKVVNVPSLGSSGAIRALAENKLDVVVSGRPLTSDEIAQGLVAAAVLRTPYFIVSSHGNPIELSSADLAALYAKPAATWPDGAPVRVILRPRSDSDSDLMAALFPGMGDALEAARRRPEVPTAATDQDNLELAERIPNSLTGMTATQFETEGHHHLRPVTLDGVEPSFANYENGRYRYGKNLYLITRSAGGPDVGRFLEFVRSAEGVKLLRDAEVLPGTP